MNKSLSPQEQINSLSDLALAEDLGHGDVTTEVLIPPDLKGKASILIQEKGILAGIEIVRKVFHRVDPSLKTEVLLKDGAAVKPGDIAATVSGTVASILKTERIALNFLQRLSGIATQTAEYVAETSDQAAVITDTRKTTPGLRVLEKQAVFAGGGKNHRLHLGDGFLIKDNHIVALRALGIDLKDIVTKAKQGAPVGMKIEVEVTTAQEATEAAGAGADIIMLDNIDAGEMRRIVSSLSGQVTTEASGGITLENVRAAARAGVNLISIGALTHSLRTLNISLELEPQSIKPV
ncbi:MAG: nicotinate-nucleotide diphosphorylase (carboxylating) [Dehalococcoidales bacterium]|jgi:nicotinate-nucleotide pyrophosphorylase (carboxylating)|nr:nicotinate-nucleotide diphosphorylase (carboxylating) [Dehalococcoidales bacterium]MDP6448599.1 carboxylating nicotinate-nucleotide diphosphorylase [Dehalococcoidales bacterium]MDP6577246.1 carboxylating nicotinate-nucleotide diphosphorylase [Dehalococcoidales bacterium]MDP6824633.1 carboxylating nicotinate-nucleotide diphosphorylase [Dehalococcoidales bacterium]|tara:strand:+ start:1029 stop:1907 length:879 start_codon:yes stop_codon:yes gene_type:complete